MTESLDGVSPGNTEPRSVDSAPEQPFGLVGGSGGVSGGPLEMDNEADLGGLREVVADLSSLTAPQLLNLAGRALTVSTVPTTPVRN
jgi:hypothetical protein